MTVHIRPTAALDEPLARAVVYRVASELFFHPARASRTWPEWLPGLRAALEACAETGSPPELGLLWERCLEAGRDAGCVRREHERVIGPTPRAGAVPYETEWLGAAGDLLQFHQISDIAAFYHAFGLELGRDCDERADHLAVELAFLHFLCVKQGWADEHGQPDLAQCARDAQRTFLDQHVARWVPAFCAHLIRATGEGFYADAARALRAWIDDECRRTGAQPGNPDLAPSESSLSIEDCNVSCERTPTSAAEDDDGH